MDINKTYWYIKNYEPPCFLITHKNYKSDHFLGQKASFNTFHVIAIIQSTVSDDKDKHYPIGSVLLVQTGVLIENHSSSNPVTNCQGHRLPSLQRKCL